MTDTATATGSTVVRRRVDPIVAVVIDESESTDRTAATAAVAIRAAQQAVGSERVLVVGPDATEAWARRESVRWIGSDGTPLGGLERAVLAADGAPLLYCSGNSAVIAAGLDALVASLAPDAMTVSGAERDVDGEPISTPTLFDWMPRPGTLIATDVVAADTEHAGLVAALRHAARNGRANLQIDAVTVARIGDTSAGAHVRTDAWTAAAIVRSVRSSLGHGRAGRVRDLAAAVADATRALRGLAVLAALILASAAILASGAGGPSAWIMPAIGMVIVATGALALLERQRPGGAVSELVRSIDVSAWAIAAIVRRRRRHRSRPVRSGGLALLARPVTTFATIALESAISYASVRLATADRADPVGTRATIAALAAGIVLLAPMLVSLGVVVRVRPRRASSRAELAFNAAVDGRPTRVVDVSIGGLAVSASSPITVGHRVGVLLDPEDGALPMTVVRCSPHGRRHVIGLQLDPDAPPAARAALERTWLEATQRIVTATAVRPARAGSPSGARTPAGGRATWTIGGSVAVRVATAVTLIALGAAVLPPYPTSLAAGVVVVNSTGLAADDDLGDGSCDTGVLNSAAEPECTLRAAIEEANAAPTIDTIEFAIPTTDLGYSAGRGVFTIAPTSNLPALSTAITINGASQAVNVANTNPGTLGSVGSVGTGPDGVLGTGDEPTLDGVAAPEIELDYSGQLGLVAAADGVSISGLAVFGANPDVMIAGGSGVVVEDMVIGTRADSFTDPGAGDRSTGSGGVAVFAGSGTQVRNNLIGYQSNRGIEVSGTMSALTIAGNEITGTSQGTTVEGGGIEIVNYWNSGGAITGLLVTGNLIHELVDDHGIEVATDVADSGVVIDDNTIIGTSPLIVYGNQTVDGGTITHNVVRDSISSGIYADAVTDWTISENSITNSTWEGIGLSGTANDGITAPSITQATAGVGTVTADYSITAPAGAYQVELFDNTVAGSGGVGEGETYLGTDPIIHPGGTATYRHTVNGGLGDIVTATLTEDLGGGDLGSTSAFSNAFTVTEVLEPVVLDRIQKGTATIANGSSSTSVNIAAVDPSRSFLTYSIRGNASTPNDMQVRGELTDSDTVTFSRYGTTTAIAIEWSVVAFQSGVTVQRGTTSLSTTTTDLAISSVDLSRSFPITNVSVGGAGFGADDFVRAELTSSTNLRLHVRAVNLTNAVSWQVITYSEAAVQSGTVAFGSAVSSAIATPTAVDPSTAWLVYSVDSAAGTTANIAQKLVRGVVTNPTTLTFDRASTGQAMNVTWYLVEFTDDTLVQSGSSAFGTGTTQNDVSITTVDPTRSVATGGHLGFGGRSSYTADDNPGVGWFTTRLTSATNVRATRGVTGSATADLGWFVITWSDAGSRTVTVNATDDDADLFPGDGYCDTGGVNASGVTECTLRAAIQEANASTVIDTVHFDIPTGDAGHSAGVWTISLLGSSAVRVSAATTIDATTQPGYVTPSTTFPDAIDGAPVVRIDRGAGSTIEDAIWLDADADGSLVRGVSITGFNGANSSAVTVESAGVSVVANWLGIAPDGSIDANQVGVDVGWGATDTVVGGPSPADRNRIVGNSYAAVAVFDSTTTGTVIKGNEMSQNGLFGVVLWSGTSGNEIGGAGAGDGNIIESNGTGILVDANATASFSVILGNRIVGNAGLGIELLYDGVTANDTGDVDSGPNDLLNFPVISSAGSAGATVDVSYSLDVPAGNYRVEFFANPSGADPTGYGEGETFVHAETISHTGLGTAGYTASFAGSIGDVITATATEDLGGGSFGSTSEFSAAVTVASSIVVVNSTGTAGDAAIGDGSCQTATAGECTLRAAIAEANAHPLIDTIHFAIPGPGPTWTIAPPDSVSGTPTITAPLTIDATTQPGWSGDPVVVLDGSAVAGGDGFSLGTGSGGSEIRGFVIGGYPSGDGIQITTDGNTIAGNWIGTDATGTAADPIPSGAGIYVTGGTGNVIGGSNPADRNVIGATGNGINVSGEAVDGTQIVGNHIGIGADGSADIGNTGNGIVVLNGADDTLVADNVIGFNDPRGVSIVGATSGTTVQGNLIGVAADGTTPAPNASHAIALDAGATDNLIGGTDPGDGNVVANTSASLFDGVRVFAAAGTDNAILGNSISGNGEPGGLGIDLGAANLTPNDAGDVDSGSNDLLNFPEISSAVGSGATVDVSYSLDVPAGNYRVEFFANPSGADPTGYGEGETFVHAETISHTGLGTAGFTASFAGSLGDVITATATEDLGGGSFGSTSEFSAAVTVASSIVVVNSTGDDVDQNVGDGVCQTGTPGECTLRAAIQEADAIVGIDTIHFAIPGPGPTWTITPGSALPTVTDTVTIDATTQTGWAATPIVVLDGVSSGGAVGLTIGGADTVVRGFAIGRFVRGLDVLGSAARAVIADNHIGVDAAGTTAFANDAQGLTANADDVVISGNVVAGNGADGIIVSGAARTRIVDNRIGTDASGNVAIPNDQEGIEIMGTTDVVIGAPGAGNVISGNRFAGINGWSLGSTGVVVQSNLIGVGADGTTALGNGATVTEGGITFRAANSGWLIGGTGAGEGNVIANNVGDGIQLSTVNGTSTDITVIGNEVFANTGLGIDHGDDGVTPDDTSDVDTGSNDLLNFPVISSVAVSGAALDVTYSLDVPAGDYRIEFFANLSGADPTGYGEGKTFVQAETISHTGLGTVGFTASLPATAGYITATATEDLGGGSFGSTSEFSAAVCIDSDGDGLCFEDWNRDGDADPATDPGPDTDGDTIPNYLDADDDGDGIPTADENGDPNGNGDPRDALDTDRDGQPDYLDIEAGPSSTPVADEQKISATSGGLVGPLDDSDNLGQDVTGIGDLDGDGINDLAVGVPEDDDGGPSRGAVYVLFMNADGTVRAEQKISDTAGGFNGVLTDFGEFGHGIATIGDVDGDGVTDIAVGTWTDVDGGPGRGAVWILFLERDGTVKAHRKISDTTGGLVAALDDYDRFGSSLSGLGDLDGDGTPDLAVGAREDDDGGADRGAAFILFLNTDGSVRAEQKISATAGGLTGVLDDLDEFGHAVAGIGDLDGDGIGDVAVGAPRGDDGGTDRGAVHVLFLNADGTVRAEQKLSAAAGPLAAALDDHDWFGSALAGIGDLDGNATPDLAVGARGDTDGAWNAGAVHLLRLAADGTIVGAGKISATSGGLTGPLEVFDHFGRGIGSLGDLDGDGALNLAVSARYDDDGGPDRGAVYILDLSPPPVPTVVVNSTGDAPDQTPGDGYCQTGAFNSAGDRECTLRAAIEEANASVIVDSIHFDIPASDPGHAAGVWSIEPSAALPSVAAAVVLDASSQPGWATTPVVAIDGSGIGTATDGVTLAAGSSGSEVRGLAVGGFSGHGIVIDFGSSGNLIAGNHIGTDAGGLVDAGNGSAGILVWTDGNTIGGATAADRNVISGNGGYGIFVGATTGNVFRGNHIGVDVTGNTALGNTWNGIYLGGGDGNAVDGNVIGGNGDIAVRLEGGANHVITANSIGVGADGVSDVGNLVGVSARFGSEDIVIGGSDPSDANVIAHNGHGILVMDAATDDVAIIGNEISDNDDLGIDLEDDDVTANDPGDVDAGANTLLNAPVISSAVDTAGTVDVDLDLDVPAGSYRVEFFMNPSGADPSGYGEGEMFVHAETISHAGLGTAGFTASFAGSAGDVITATVTEDLGGGSYGSTSEFSAAVFAATSTVTVNSTGGATDQTPGDGVCWTGTTNSAGDPECTLRAALHEANNNTVVDTVHFDIPNSDPNHAGGTWTITPAGGSATMTVTQPVTIDATTQPGAVANTAVAPAPINGRLAIELSGAAGLASVDWDGLLLLAPASGSTIRGIAFVDWNGSSSDAILAWVSSDNVVAGNFFGVRADGVTDGSGNTAAVGLANGSARNRIGGAAAADRNLFAGASSAGDGWSHVWVEGATSIDNVVLGNEFGSVTGGVDSPATTPAVMVLSGEALVGGTTAAAGNRISGGWTGVAVVEASGPARATVIGNRLVGQSSIAIDLAADGPTANDAGDVDTGPNDLLNVPVITSAAARGGQVDLTFDIDAPAGTYRIELFANPSGAGPSGYGQGEDLVDVITVAHPGGGSHTYTARVPGAAGDLLAVTATEDLGPAGFGSTSEFSSVVTVVAGAEVPDLSQRRSDLATAGGASGPGGAGVVGTGVTFGGGRQRLVGPATDVTSGAVTVSAWVQLDATSTAPRLVSKRAQSGAIYELLVDDATGAAEARFGIGGSEVTVQGGTLTVGTWHDVTATWDGSTVRLYVDGIEVAQAPAAGALDTDLSSPLVVGNVVGANRGLVGSVDVVQVAHTARSAAWIETAYLNQSDPAGFVSVGEVETAAAGTWSASSSVVRTGSGALAAPAATNSSQAWATATGLDEPGLAFESWWYVTSPASTRIAAGTNAGPTPIEQRELGSTTGTVDLATRSVGNRTVDASSPTAVPTAVWTRVEIRTDELGRSTAWVDGVQILGPTPHSGGTSAGTAGLRAETVGAGGWYVDDVRIRRYVSDEPTTTLGPLHRN